MSARTNYSGHYSGPSTARPQGIVFRKGKGNARFSPYMWLVCADYERGRTIKLDFGHYEVVLQAAVTFGLDDVFEAITRHELAELPEKEDWLSIEINEKKEEREPA